MILDDFDAGENDNYLHKVSSKQETFLVITGLLLWITIALSITNIYFFYQTIQFNDNIEKLIVKSNNSNISQEISQYFKQNKKYIQNDCYTFDGKQFLVTSPMVLSDNAKSKIQFPLGLKLPGMTISSTKIDLYGSILFNNNLYPTSQIVGDNQNVMPQSSMNSNFIGKPGYTEIGLLSSSSTGATCAGLKSAIPGDNTYPFPGVYVNTIGSNRLCICLNNWLRRITADNWNSPLRLALEGTGPYNTPGEYCVPLN